jgi:hypothetical protein
MGRMARTTLRPATSGLRSSSWPTILSGPGLLYRYDAALFWAEERVSAQS